MLYGFVVEGLHDKDLLERNFKNVMAIHCSGTKFTNKEKRGIESLLSTCDKVYLLFDPDDQGDLFTQQVQNVYPLPAIRLDLDKCKLHLRNRVKIGVEHADVAYLHSALGYWGIQLIMK